MGKRTMSKSTEINFGIEKAIKHARLEGLGYGVALMSIVIAIYWIIEMMAEL